MEHSGEPRSAARAHVAGCAGSAARLERNSPVSHCCGFEPSDPIDENCATSGQHWHTLQLRAL